MQKVMVPGSSVTVSRFIFGTSSLFMAGGRHWRTALLEAAVDQGFTHFDTAPYYGFGAAERDLAPVLRRNRHVTVTTKVGLYSPGGEQQPDWAVLLRKVGGKALPAMSRPLLDFSLQRARRSLHESLRRLGRECVDFYLLHEPQFPLVETDEWLGWLQETQTQGKVRHFGLAGKPEAVVPFVEANSPLADIVQMPDSLSGHEADLLTNHGRPLQLTYAYVSAARKADPTADAETVLRRALQRNRDGAIIVSTLRRERLAQYVKVLKGDSSSLFGRAQPTLERPVWERGTKLPADCPHSCHDDSRYRRLDRNGSST